MGGQLAQSRGIGYGSGAKGDDAAGGHRWKLRALLVTQQRRAQQRHDHISGTASPDELRKVAGRNLGWTKRVHLEPLDFGDADAGTFHLTRQAGQHLVGCGLGKKCGIPCEHREAASVAEMFHRFPCQGVSHLRLDTRIPAKGWAPEGKHQGRQ